MLTFRASNVLNFAHAAMGMYVGYTYYGLRNFGGKAGATGGDLVLPIIGLPATVHVVDRPTVVTALAISMVVAVLLAVVVYGLVFRPLRNAPPLARIVASLGIFLYLQSVMQLRAAAIGSGSALQLKSFLPRGVVRLGDAAVPTSSFVLAGIAIACTVGLAAVFRYTRFGLATRAAAENETGAILTGLSPDRLGYVNWIIATVLAGLAIILFAGASSRLDPTDTSLLIIPALAAALFGRLDSFAIATVAALAISMFQSVLGTFQSRAEWLPDWLPRGGLAAALPVILIIAAVTFRGDRLPTREALVDRHLPAAPLPRHPLVATLILAGIALLALLTLDEQWRLAIVVSVIATIIALSSVVLTGYVGQISLAQYAFAGLAAFVTAKLAIEGVAFPWSPLLAVLVTVAVGLLIGLPAVRVRGMLLAVVTLGAAAAIEVLVFASPSLAGLGDVPAPRLFGVNLGFLSTGSGNFRASFGVFAIGVLAVCGLLVANLRRSATGLRWLAVRSNERAAAACAVDVSRAKLSAFAISSGLAGVGGVLLAYELPKLSPLQFMVVGALAVLALCYLGGIATISGAIVAGVLAAGGILTQLQGGATGEGSTYQFAISGLMLIVVVILYPDGLSNAVRRSIERLRPAS